MKHIVIILLLTSIISHTKDCRKHFPAPTDVIKIDKERSIIHHVALALIPGAPEVLTQAIILWNP